MSSVLEVPAQLALAILLATGPVPAEPILPVDVEPQTMAQGVVPEDLDTASPTPKVDFGYSDEVWLRLVQAHGETAGIGPLARRIFRTSNGRIYAPVPDDRKTVLALKRNTAVAASITTTVARANAQRLSRLVDRPITTGDLFMAHQLGLDEAMRLLTAAEREPRRSAAEMMPAAALANPSAFFHGLRPRTVEAVVQHYTAAFDQSVRGHLRASVGTSVGASSAPSGAKPPITHIQPQQASAAPHSFQPAVAGWRTAITTDAAAKVDPTIVHAYAHHTASAD